MPKLTINGKAADRMRYYAMRAAALGPVSAEVVAAVFYHHSVDMVSPSIPLAWSIASPETIVAARFEAVDGALRRLFPQQIHSSEVAEAAELVREALVGCSVAGPSEARCRTAHHLLMQCDWQCRTLAPYSA